MYYFRYLMIVLTIIPLNVHANIEVVATPLIPSPQLEKKLLRTQNGKYQKVIVVEIENESYSAINVYKNKIKNKILNKPVSILKKNEEKQFSVSLSLSLPEGAGAGLGFHPVDILKLQTSIHYAYLFYTLKGEIELQVPLYKSLEWEVGLTYSIAISHVRFTGPLNTIVQEESNLEDYLDESASITNHYIHSLILAAGILAEHKSGHGGQINFGWWEQLSKSGGQEFNSDPKIYDLELYMPTINLSYFYKFEGL